MSLPKRMIARVPEETAEVARKAFPKGHVYMQMRDELGTIYTDDLFADLYPVDGQPAIRPWRLALIVVMQFGEGLSDRQAVEAVGDRITWKYALSLELTDVGFDYSVLSEFRDRLVENEASQRLLDEMLQQCRERGYIKVRGQQRTDATHVLAAIRNLNRLENVGTTLTHALNSLAVVAPDWLREQVEPIWFERYALHFSRQSLPKGKKKRSDLAQQVGQDGMSLLEAIYDKQAPNYLREVPAIESLRRLWVQQFWSDDGQVKLRDVNDMPAVGEWLRSPFDLEARYAKKRDLEWVGYKVHLSETCDEGHPHLITQVESSSASVPDSQSNAAIQADLAQKGLVPSQQIVDAGYVDSQQLLSSQAKRIDLFGPAPADMSWQARSEGGIVQSQFTIDWDKQEVTCPQGQMTRQWSKNYSKSKKQLIRIKFDVETCQNCKLRENCTRGQARTLALLPRAEYEALQAARQRQESDAFKQQYTKRAGVEGTISQAVSVGDGRRSRYIGLKKTHLQNIAIASAINLYRVINWLNEKPLAPTRKSRFAILAA